MVRNGSITNRYAESVTLMLSKTVAEKESFDIDFQAVTNRYANAVLNCYALRTP
jgi:hypothetical protein